jgi:hypothetical protein
MFVNGQKVKRSRKYQGICEPFVLMLPFTAVNLLYFLAIIARRPFAAIAHHCSVLGLDFVQSSSRLITSRSPVGVLGSRAAIATATFLASTPASPPAP